MFNSDLKKRVKFLEREDEKRQRIYAPLFVSGVAQVRAHPHDPLSTLPRYDELPVEAVVTALLVHLGLEVQAHLDADAEPMFGNAYIKKTAVVKKAK